MSSIEPSAIVVAPKPRRPIDWRILAAAAALVLVVALIGSLVVAFIQPGRTAIQRIDSSTERSACVTEERSKFDLALADLIAAAIDQDAARIAELRPELDVARDRLARLDELCPVR